MKLILKEQRQRMLLNGRLTATGQVHLDPMPVVKLFTTDAGATWLLTELDPEDPDRAFGLCDLGLGCPELGYVSLAEIAKVRGCIGLPVTRDQWWTARGPLSAYAAAARRAGHIVQLPEGV